MLHAYACVVELCAHIIMCFRITDLQDGRSLMRCTIVTDITINLQLPTFYGSMLLSIEAYSFGQKERMPITSIDLLIDIDQKNIIPPLPSEHLRLERW